MIQRQIRTQLLLWLLLVCALTTSSIGQTITISLEEAVNIARKNYAGLERDQFAIDQQNQLADSGMPMLPTQLFISGEEFGVNNQTGIHSLNIQQNFYLPKVGKVQKELYMHGATVSKKQMALTDQDLKRRVQQAYYQLIYAKQEKELVEENLSLYNNFLLLATTQLESGETGKIPQLSARSRLGQAKLEQEHASEKYQIALTLFNLWLQSDNIYDVQDELSFERSFLPDSTMVNNPHLNIIRAEREFANAKIESEKVLLLPQINSGFRLQTAFGNFPLFGYQVGVNIPLFKKAYQGRIKAAEIGVKVQEANLRTKEQELIRTVSELNYRIEHQIHVLEYLQQDLTPIVNEQSEVNLKAYKEGEISYLEYLDGLEQVIKIKQQYLTALFKFNSLRVELDYWLGK